MAKSGILIVTDDSLTQKPGKLALRARDRFEGSFQEVRTFENRLADISPTVLRIVSARHGMLDGQALVEPYDSAERPSESVAAGVAALRDELTQSWAAIILVLKSETIRRLIAQSNLLRVAGPVVFVGALNLAEPVRIALGVDQSAFYSYRRLGVARIGRSNQEAILQVLTNKLSARNSNREGESKSA